MLASPALQPAPDSRAPDSPEPVALYVHWPFCKAKCPYCDFNSHVREAVDQAAWRAALVAELRHAVAQLGRRPLASIFFGGGTPSLMPPETVAAVIDTATDLLDPLPDLEVTLEANPTSVDAGRFAGYRSAGVNRVSLGVQALDPQALRFLGRQHSVEEALAAVALAARLFPRFSFDLIHTRPGQSAAAWEAELAEALQFGARHLSLYQLTIEPNTAFAGAVRRGELVMPDEDMTAQLFEATQAQMEAAGMPAYEISNHAVPGEESRHNLVYWRWQDFLGIGPGAHGRVTLDGTTYATRRHRAPESWLGLVQTQGHGGQGDEALDADTMAMEALVMGARVAEGIDAARFRRRTGQALWDLVDSDALAMLRAGGFVGTETNRLRLTAAGRQRLNAVLEKLLR